MKNKTGIYKITNKIDNKAYYGSDTDNGQRWNEHLYHLKQNTHHNKHLQAAWNRDGTDNFIFEMIEIYEKQDFVSKESFCDFVISREQHYLDLYWDNCKNCYNICPTAGNVLGRKHSNETKHKIGKANSTKLKGKNHPNYGKHLPEQTKAKISKSLSGHKVSNKTRERQSVAATGRSRSLEAIRKQIETVSGKNSANAKLTMKQINEIRQKYKPYRYTQQKLADEYGVSLCTINYIILNKIYKHSI